MGGRTIYDGDRSVRLTTHYDNAIAALKVREVQNEWCSSCWDLVAKGGNRGNGLGGGWRHDDTACAGTDLGRGHRLGVLRILMKDGNKSTVHSTTCQAVFSFRCDATQ